MKPFGGSHDSSADLTSLLYRAFADIAITGHRRCLTALFALLHHRNVRLAQGEIIPVVIKITEKDVARKEANGS